MVLFFDPDDPGGGGGSTCVEWVSQSVTVTAVGGTGPYTYSWARLSGDASISADSPSSATTTFSRIVCASGTRVTTMRCTVTDSLGATDHVDVTVTL